MGCEKACIWRKQEDGNFFFGVWADRPVLQCVCVCVFSGPLLPPATKQSAPPPLHLGSRSGGFYLQCDGVKIADWGIITRAIKERFTGRAVSGVSAVSALQD